MDIKKHKYGFTLAESLIVIVIIGVLSALALPVYIKVKPDRVEEMLKKTTFSVENMVAQIINDESMYPRSQDYDKQGLKNLDRVVIAGKTYQNKEKFCRLFASRFEKRDENVLCLTETQVNNYFSNPSFSAIPSFVSADGVEWYLAQTDFAKGYTELVVDVNGDQCPNTWDLDTLKSVNNKNNSCNGTYKTPDRKKFYVRFNGVLSSEVPHNERDMAPYSIVVERICNANEGPFSGCTNGSIYIIEKDEFEAGKRPVKTDMRGLKLNKTYILQACPGIGGTRVSWPNPYYNQKRPDSDENYVLNSCSSTNAAEYAGFKAITIDGSSQVVRTTIRYSPQTRRDINIIVNNCSEETPTTGGENGVKLSKCLEVRLSMCEKWKEVDGVGHTDGTCTGNTLFTQENMAISQLSKTSLLAGNYKIAIKPVFPYDIYGRTWSYTPSAYYRYLKLGTEDAKLIVNLQRPDTKEIEKIEGAAGPDEVTIALETDTKGWDKDGNEYNKQVTPTVRWIFGTSIYQEK